MEHSAFPSDETLAAFIDGRLDEEMRKKVVAHVADCEECYGTVMAAGAWRSSEDAAASRPSIPNRRVPYAAILAAAAAVAGILLFQPLSLRYRESRDHNALRAAGKALAGRPVDARLSLDLDYRRMVRLRSANDDNDESRLDVAVAVSDIKKERDESPTVSARHSLGLAYLLFDARDEAIKELVGAIEQQTSTSSLREAIRESRDANLLNDLSAALGAQADAGGDPSLRELARDAAERAWNLDPHAPISAWNRAVAIERMGPRAAAIRAWNDYLAVDQGSPWRAEAVKRLGKLHADRAVDM